MIRNFLAYFTAIAIGTLLSFPGQAQADWAKNFGGVDGSYVQIYGIAVDSSGNTYVAGSTGAPTLVIGGVTLTLIGIQDAIVAKLDSTGSVLWAKNFGGSGANVYANGVAVDGSGNVYLAGKFDSANLTTPALTAIGNADAFAMKLDSSGNTTWAKNFGGSGATTSGQGIAVDGSGNVYVGGYFYSGNLTTPAFTRFGIEDAFALKLDSSGNTTWAKNYGGSGATASGQGVAVDGSGNVYLCGNFSSAYLTTPAVSLIGGSDAFAFKLDSSGNTTWAKNFGGAGATTQSTSVAVDGSGNVYLAGYFLSANMTTPALTRIGTYDAFAIKLDSSGSTTWATNFGGSGANTAAYGIAVDGSGNVYLGGSFQAASLTTPALTAIGTGDTFAFKLDSSGNTTWAKNFGGSHASGAAQAVAVDGSGNVYLGGWWQLANLTTPAITKTGNTDAYAFKLDSSGNTSWTKAYGATYSAGSTQFTGIAKDTSTGSIYMTGNFLSLAHTFGSVTLNRIGDKDAFIVKMDASGTVLWAKNYGGFGATASGQSVAVDGSGNVYLAGYFTAASLTTPALTKIGTYDAFVLKLDSSGNTTWAKNYSGSLGATTRGQSIAVDGSGNVYLGGYFSGTNLSTPALTKIGTTDAYALKLDSSGNTTWAKNFGGAGANAFGQTIAVDGSGNVYLGGYFQTANLTTPAVTKIGTADAYAFKLDSSGSTTWSKNFGGAGASGRTQGIAVDGSGNVYLGGYFSGANLTTPAVTKIGSSDAFAFKLDSSGSTTWSKNFGGAGATALGQSISVDGSGNVYLGGYFSGANLTTPAFTKIGSQDGFGVKTDASGTTLWSKNYGGSGAYVYLNGITADGTGNVYLGAYFSGASLTTPALTKIGLGDDLIIDAQLYKTSCTTAGKMKYDSTNNVMVFCDGSYWQSMNNAKATACTGTTNGKVEYYSNGGSSDFVWYAVSCRSSKSTTTYGACTTNGKFEWYATDSTVRGCINGTWTSLKGW